MDSVIKLLPGWDNSFFGFNHGTIFVIILLISLMFFTMLIATKFIPTIFSSICKKSELAEKAITKSSGALGIAFGAFIAWYLCNELLASKYSMMPELIKFALPALSKLLIVIAGIIWALRLTGIIHAVVDWWDDDDELDGTEKTLITALESVMRFIIIIFGSILIANALDFDLTTLIAGLGITGLALALAAKDTISNIFGAISVLLDRPFKVGDWVVASGNEGEVVEIGLRTTLLRTSLDTVITVPNASLVNKSIENYGKRRWRRFQPTLYIDLDSKPEAIELFCKGIEKLIQDCEKTTKKESSWATVSIISKDSIEIGCNLYWDVSNSLEERRVRQDWLIDITRLAKNEGIKFFEPRVRNQIQKD